MLPELREDDMPPSGHWHSTPENPAEHTWLLNVEEALNKGALQTRRWMTRCLQHSRKIAVFSPLEERSVLMMFRPCNRCQAFQEQYNIAQVIPYSFLDGQSLEDLRYEAEDRLTELLEDLDQMDMDERPSGLLITYQDDYDMLLYAAEKAPEFYEEFCGDRGLLEDKD